MTYSTITWLLLLEIAFDFVPFMEADEVGLKNTVSWAYEFARHQL